METGGRGGRSGKPSRGRYLALWKSCEGTGPQIPLAGFPQSPLIAEISQWASGPQAWHSKDGAAKSFRALKTQEREQKSITRKKTAKPHTLSRPAFPGGQLHPLKQTKAPVLPGRKETESNKQAPPSSLIFRSLPRPPLSPGKGPGAAHLLARRKRAAGGGQVPSPGRLAASEHPAAKPGGAPGRRESAAGSPRRPPPAPPVRLPWRSEQHLHPAAVGGWAGRKAASAGGARPGSRAAKAARSTRRSLAPCPSAG